MTDWDAVERNVRRAIAYLQRDLSTQRGSDFRPDPADLVLPATINPVETGESEANSPSEPTTTLC